MKMNESIRVAASNKVGKSARQIGNKVYSNKVKSNQRRIDKEVSAAKKYMKQHKGKLPKGYGIDISKPRSPWS